MAKKFLTKDGLDRFFAKLKGRFAQIESPAFKGQPTVETLEFERFSSGKEVINREYASNMFKAAMDYIESEKQAFRVRLMVKPEEWKMEKGIYYCPKLQSKVEDANFEQVSIFIRIDTLELSPEKLLDVHQNYPVAIDKEGVIYTAGEKPTYELPIIVDIILSTDITQWLGGN